MGSVTLTRERALIGQEKNHKTFFAHFPPFDHLANNIKKFFFVDNKSTPSKLHQLS